MKTQKMNEALQKVLRAIDKMEESRDVDYTEQIVKISDRLTIRIECTREANPNDNEYGMAFFFELYAIVKGEEVDCVTLHDETIPVEEDIMFLLKCYMYASKVN